ncbi:MAG: hypothetical protein LBE57_04965 [Methanosarcinales archaeon]|nr:hypothetical protein [Methanosarcinales archaeon]
MTYQNIYIQDEYVCVNYASDLTAAAEKNGIRCGFVLLTFGENMTSHTLNVFMLEDGQYMFVDTTGSQNKPGTVRFFFDLESGSDYKNLGTIYNVYQFW